MKRRDAVNTYGPLVAAAGSAVALIQGLLSWRMLAGALVAAAGWYAWFWWTKTKRGQEVREKIEGGRR